MPVFSRRALLRGLSGMMAAAMGESAVPPPAPMFTAQGVSPEDDAFLEEVEKASFQFFIEQADPTTGLVKDRATLKAVDTGIVASTAATGFGLTALCIGQKRGYISLSDAHQRVVKTLEFLWNKMPTHRGFYFHFANIQTGERIWDSEVSSIDTALLLCGVLTCREHFPYADVRRLAYEIYARVEWSWLAEDTTLLAQGWSPEGGFLPYRWDLYSELMMMYLLGLGSLTHPLPPGSWDAWKRQTFDFDGLRYIGSFAPLFVNQYSQAWFDFRGKRDRYADYFLNSIIATEVHRLFCLQLSKEFKDYSNDLWGITASDSKKGYVVWGGPPEMGAIDGTIVPCATGGSLPFLPTATLGVLRNIKSNYPQAWSKYGFVDAFNPLTKWYDDDVVGIDTGITMTMAENLRTGFVWDTFMKNPEAQRGFQEAGLQKYQVDYTKVQEDLVKRTK